MTLHYKKVGEGQQSLVILHGLMGTLDNWVTLAGQFAEWGLSVYLVDQRNHGRSPHSDEWNYEVMASDLAEFIETHQLENPIVLGHSMGGKTVMRFASEHADKLSKLIVADIAPKYYAPHHQRILEGLNAIDPSLLKSRGEADKELASYISEMGVRQFLLKNLYRNEDKEFAWRMNLPVITENIEIVGEALPEAYGYEGPTLFVRGERSDYILDADWLAIERQFPKATLATVNGAGHWLHAEKPVEFMEAVKGFILV